MANYYTIERKTGAESFKEFLASIQNLFNENAGVSIGVNCINGVSTTPRRKYFQLGIAMPADAFKNVDEPVENAMAVLFFKRTCTQQAPSEPKAEPAQKYKPLCKDSTELGHLVSDIHWQKVDVMSTTEQLCAKLMAVGGAITWRVYEAIPEYIDRILKRVIEE